MDEESLLTAQLTYGMTGNMAGGTLFYSILRRHGEVGEAGRTAFGNTSGPSAAAALVTILAASRGTLSSQT